jgi:hypothetical protein
VIDDRGTQPSEDEAQDDLVDVWHGQILLHSLNVRLGQLTQLLLGRSRPFVTLVTR